MFGGAGRLGSQTHIPDSRDAYHGHMSYGMGAGVATTGKPHSVVPSEADESSFSSDYCTGLVLLFEPQRCCNGYRRLLLTQGSAQLAIARRNDGTR